MTEKQKKAPRNVLAESISALKLALDNVVPLCGDDHAAVLLDSLSNLEDAISRSTTSNPTHMCWASMIQRCTNPKNPNFNRYGGRGITVCDRWRQYKAFVQDVGVRPSSHHSLDRIDNEAGYKPGNVRWATRQQQANNTSQTKFVKLDSGETVTFTEFALRHFPGINKSSAQRIRNKLFVKGWSVSDVLTGRTTQTLPKGPPPKVRPSPMHNPPTGSKRLALVKELRQKGKSFADIGCILNVAGQNAFHIFQQAMGIKRVRYDRKKVGPAK